MQQFCLLKLSSDERKLSSLKDIYHKRQRENKQMPDQSFMPSSQPSHPPEVTFISLLHLSLEDVLGWFLMAWPLLPPPVLCWNSTWRDEAAWERIQLERTSKHSLSRAAPLLHNLEDAAGPDLLLGLQLLSCTWNCSGRVFPVLPTGQVHSIQETGQAQVVEMILYCIYFFIQLSVLQITQ